MDLSMDIHIHGKPENFQIFVTSFVYTKQVLFTQNKFTYRQNTLFGARIWDISPIKDEL